SIRHWWEQIEHVCLFGSHEALSPHDPEGSDQLVIWSFDDEWSELVDMREFGQTGFQLSLERDAYAVRVPDGSADARIRPDRLWFVDYLRDVFEWGGFPGWKYRKDPPVKEIGFLREGLLEI